MIRTRKFDISQSYQPFVYQILLTVADVQSGGIVAEEELQLLIKPNPVLTPEEDDNQCRKAGYGQVLHEPFLKFLKHEEGDESEVSQETERLAVEYCDPKPVCKARHACGGDRTMTFADVLWRTLSGRPLLSSRRYFRRIAWHQVRQNKQLNEPTDVEINEWNISHQN
ncbi:hypothetical protein Bca52824_053321 [Brassica carinata]|uniref:Uncharacterized protein n=1 Tax=Brassica carinata TaxID=52824 RepID=A0A8X7R5H3_BRACI|nr:hypothetical protein Bca52824_053321 [Brassica carinata]